MTVFHIKLIAVITMIIDHIGYLFFPQDPLFRIIGRLSFPLFAWLIANGAYHTRNIKAYIIRLYVFASVSQYPYMLFFQERDSSYFQLNIFFTLALGLTTIAIIRKIQNRGLLVLITFVSAVIATILRADYGAMGILSIVTFYLLFRSSRNLLISQIIIFTLPPILLFLFNEEYYDILFFLQLNSSIQPYAVFSFIFILLYNHKQGPKFKYLFYSIYPFHFILLYVIKLVL